MKPNKIHKGLCGIYCIRNLINDKKYIGFSKNIRNRITDHRSGLNRKDKTQENQQFIDDWHHFGDENFEYFILEILDKNLENLDKVGKDIERDWMKVYESTNVDKGYNLRQDCSEKGMLVHPDTLERMKLSRKIFIDNLTNEDRIKMSEKISKFWKNNPEIKNVMSIKLSDIKTQYKIEQYSKDWTTLIKTWDKLKDIIKENPDYKVHNIYACCSGEKPSMYGYRWVKVLIDDIVQTI